MAAHVEHRQTTPSSFFGIWRRSGGACPRPVSFFPAPIACAHGAACPPAAPHYLPPHLLRLFSSMEPLRYCSVPSPFDSSGAALAGIGWQAATMAAAAFAAVPPRCMCPLSPPRPPPPPPHLTQFRNPAGFLQFFDLQNYPSPPFSSHTCFPCSFLPRSPPSAAHPCCARSACARRQLQCVCVSLSSVPPAVSFPLLTQLPSPNPRLTHSRTTHPLLLFPAPLPTPPTHTLVLLPSPRLLQSRSQSRFEPPPLVSFIPQKVSSHVTSPACLWFHSHQTQALVLYSSLRRILPQPQLAMHACMPLTVHQFCPCMHPHATPRLAHIPPKTQKKGKKQPACAACPLVPSASIFLLSCLRFPGSSMHRAPIIAPQPAVGASTRQTNAYIPPTASFSSQVGATGPPLAPLPRHLRAVLPSPPLCVAISVKSAPNTRHI
jgi:hypothetical protein